MSREKITAAILDGKHLRVQTRAKTVLLRPFQAGTIGKRWCFDAVVIYAHRQAIETFWEPEILAVHQHGEPSREASRTFEILAGRFDDGSLVKWEKENTVKSTI